MNYGKPTLSFECAKLAAEKNPTAREFLIWHLQRRLKRAEDRVRDQVMAERLNDRNH